LHAVFVGAARRDITDRWSFDSNQLLVELQYAFRY